MKKAYIVVAVCIASLSLAGCWGEGHDKKQASKAAAAAQASAASQQSQQAQQAHTQALNSNTSALNSQTQALNNHAQALNDHSKALQQQAAASQAQAKAESAASTSSKLKTTPPPAVVGKTPGQVIEVVPSQKIPQNGQQASTGATASAPAIVAPAPASPPSVSMPAPPQQQPALPSGNDSGDYDNSHLPSFRSVDEGNAQGKEETA